MHKIAEGYDFRNDIFFIRRPRHNNERDAVYSNFPPAGKSWLRNVQPYNLSNVITYQEHTDACCCDNGMDENYDDLCM